MTKIYPRLSELEKELRKNISALEENSEWDLIISILNRAYDIGWTKGYCEGYCEGMMVNR